MAAFRDREHAGRELARALERYRGRPSHVLAIPRGGVPVGHPVALRLDAPLSVMSLRKLHIPWSPEAGFGALTSNGEMVLNEPLVRAAGITEEVIRAVAQEVGREIQRRSRAYRAMSPPLDDLEGTVAILVDDGLASGFSMLAAIQSVKKHRPSSIVVAVPVSPLSSYQRVRPHCDVLIALKVVEEIPFAVASFYDAFPDLSDEEVKAYLRAANRTRDVLQRPER